MNEEKFNQIFDSVYVVEDREELFWLVNKLERLSPKAALEIGVEEGGSLKFWEQILPPGGLLIGVDWRDGIDNFICWPWRESDRDIHIVNLDAKSPECVEAVKEILKDRRLDFIFHDAVFDETVRTVFENFEPFLQPGGMFIFHVIDCDPSYRAVFNSIPGPKQVMKKTIGQGVWWK